MSRAVLVNCGCGKTFHREWVNLDGWPSSPEVQRCNLQDGLPFATETVDAVYHSHVLEHLRSQEARDFLRECRRVLKPGGIIRVVVPDLEGIAQAYLSGLHTAATGGDTTLHTCSRLELVDQLARTVSGGELLPFLQGLNAAERERVRVRLGREIDNMLTPPPPRVAWWRKLTPGRVWRKSRSVFLDTVVRVVGGHEVQQALHEGLFRRSGEVHRVMYDRVSLEALLLECGFAGIRQEQATTSRIPDFNRYALDAIDGATRKPDSLFMEGVRP